MSKPSPLRAYGLCSLLNLALVLGLWIGLIATAYQVLEWRAVWQLGLAALIALPVCGYFVQYLLSPMVNRLAGAWTLPGRRPGILPLAVLCAVAATLSIGAALRPGGFLAGTELGHLAALFLRLDEFHVEVDAGLSQDLVDVYWSGELESAPVRIIHRGKPDQPFPREYGPNGFAVLYADKVVLERDLHFKTAWWLYHRYRIQVFHAPTGEPAARITMK